MGFKRSRVRIAAPRPTLLIQMESGPSGGDRQAAYLMRAEITGPISAAIEQRASLLASLAEIAAASQEPGRDGDDDAHHQAADERRNERQVVEHGLICPPADDELTG